MAGYDYDLFVIGAGSGGVRASRMSAGFGARVAVCEERYLGGTCVNVGCIPKKLFVYGSMFSHDVADAAAYGWHLGSNGVDWPTLVSNKNREIERLNGVYENLLKNAGVDLIDGRGRLLDAHTIVVGEKSYTADKILIATGGWPNLPEIPGIEHAITSNEAFYLESLPKRVVIVGGGYIAVEFAGIFHGYGSQVSQLYRGPLFMRGFDDDVRKFLAREMENQGVDLRFNTDPERISKNGEGLQIGLAGGETLQADCVLYATGRNPNTTGLGLSDLGVALSWHGEIVVDENLRTNIENIYAIGDVTGGLGLTPVALAEGMALANNLFNGQSSVLDYQNVPTAVFSQPNVGTVGFTEHEAVEHCGAVTIYRSEFKPLKHTLTGREERTMMKLIVQDSTDKVVGCHMVGPEAGEIVQGFAVALKCGATKAQFDATIGIHPTAAEEFVTMRTPVSP